MHIKAELQLLEYGWFPFGKGEIRADVVGSSRIQPLAWLDRGDLRRVWGYAITANLPLHISQRMAAHATTLLASAGLTARVDMETVTAANAGAALFLAIEYGNGRGGVIAMGQRGKPSETVAEEAVAALLEFHRSDAAVDAHLADQLILPAALASGPSVLAVERVTRHLTTISWLVQQFGIARVDVTVHGRLNLVTITPGGC